MLKVRIIPTLLFKDVGLVKGIAFDSWRRVDTVLPVIKVYNLREVDELILVDINATKENKDLDYAEIKEFSKECFVPFTIGGGIRSIDQIKKLLRAGADKVVINSAAYEDINLIKSAAEVFGNQCIVSSIDGKLCNDGKYYCFSHCGTKNTGILVADWAAEVENNGAGEILITSIDQDGTMKGYDINLIKQVTTRVNIPVIASGGAGNYEDMYQVIIKGKANAVAAASVFHFTEQTPKAARDYLSTKKVPVRKTV